jgi:NADH-quinone oxidoreductase subunit L
MTLPLTVLAACAVGVGFFGTPAWPWTQGYLEGRTATLDWSRLWEGGVLGAMALSSLVAFLGIGLGWWLYGRRGIRSASTPDVLEVVQPQVFDWLRRRFYVDELYEATVIRWHAAWAGLGDLLDRWVWGGLVFTVRLAQGLAWASRACDRGKRGFDAVCHRLRKDGRNLTGLTDGKLQNYCAGSVPPWSACCCS